VTREDRDTASERALVFSHRLCWVTLTMTILALLGFRVFNFPGLIEVRAETAAASSTP
jgi:hypothetical protein